jgi:hypothetical protein
MLLNEYPLSAARLGMGALAAEELLLAFLLLKRIFSLGDSDNAQTTGFVLPTGHLLRVCLSCFTAWEAALPRVAQLNITRSQAQYIVPRGAKGT